MKIVLNLDNSEFYKELYYMSKEINIEVLNIKAESLLFDQIKQNDVDAYILSDDTTYFKRAVNHIKKRNPFIPIIGLITKQPSFDIPCDVDVYIQLCNDNKNIAKCILYNIHSYNKTFQILKKLTSSSKHKIRFSDCVYDPIHRILYHNEKEIQTLSIKEGSILEILSINFEKLVKKDVILEKVWRKNSYFTGRSMDVFLSHLRKIFRENGIKLNIKNITGVGLILEKYEYDQQNLQSLSFD